MINQILELWRWQDLFSNWPRLLTAFGNTLQVALLALLLSLFLGVVFGLMSTSNKLLLRGISRVYVEFFQNTPLPIQVFFVYYALPYAGIVLEKKLIGIAWAFTPVLICLRWCGPASAPFPKANLRPQPARVSPISKL